MEHGLDFASSLLQLFVIIQILDGVTNLLRKANRVLWEFGRDFVFEKSQIEYLLNKVAGHKSCIEIKGELDALRLKVSNNGFINRLTIRGYVSTRLNELQADPRVHMIKSRAANVSEPEPQFDSSSSGEPAKLKPQSASSFNGKSTIRRSSQPGSLELCIVSNSNTESVKPSVSREEEDALTSSRSQTGGDNRMDSAMVLSDERVPNNEHADYRQDLV